MEGSYEMKLNNIIKSLPLLSALIVVFFFTISNQNKYTKLKILIWETPSLSLGTYIAISSGAGFLMSYFITTKVANFILSNSNNLLKYNVQDNDDNSNNYVENGINSNYDNTLIERDISDPSPTINASFRVIGKTERINRSFINNTKNIQYKDQGENDDQNYEEYDTNEINDTDKGFSKDWNDESFSNW